MLARSALQGTVSMSFSVEDSFSFVRLGGILLE